MQEREGVISQECDIRVVGKGREVEGIPKERGEEVTATGENGQEEELDDVEVEV